MAGTWFCTSNRIVACRSSDRLTSMVCVGLYTLLIAIALSIDASISTRSTGADVYLAVDSGNRKSVTCPSFRSNWLYRKLTLRSAPGGTGKTLVLNMPVPIHSSNAGSWLRRT